MIHKSVLNVCFIVLVVISSACFGSENSDSQVQTAVKCFGKEGVERFEQMFQTGEFDFQYRNERSKCSVIHYAARQGDLNRVKLLVEKGADVNEKDDYRSSVLHYAVESGNLEVVQYLVEKGVDVNAKDEKNRTVLHDAALSGNLELMQWLIEQGLDVHAKSASGITPQHLFPLIKK